MAELKIRVPSGLTKSPRTTLWGVIEGVALFVVLQMLLSDTSAVEQLALIDSPEFDALREGMLATDTTYAPPWLLTGAAWAAPIAAVLKGVVSRDNAVPSEKAGAAT